MFLTLTVCAEVWGETLTLNNLGSSLTSTSNTTISTTTITATGNNKSSYVINYLQCKKQTYSSSYAMLLAKSTGAFISNKTAMPGNIKSVTVYVLTNAASKTTYHCAFSTTECTSAYTTGSTAVNITGGSSNKYICTVSNAKYFCISLGNANNGQVYKLDVEYEVDTPPSCTTNPIVSAGSNSNVTTTTATVSCLGGITSLGSAGCSIESYGFVYGTSSNPTISNTTVQVGTTYITTGDTFSKGLTGLTANTTYYVRPYATNGNGTAYGTQTSFKTLELPKYTVTLKAGPGTCAESVIETSAGAGVTLPTPTLDCGNWEFAGWTTSSVATETTSKPSTLLTGKYNPTANITLYAVYQRIKETEGSGSATHVFGWEKADDDSKWTISNFSPKETYSEYKSAGSYAASTNSKETGYIQYKDKLSPTTISCKYTKATTNTNSSSKFIIQTSTDGSSWINTANGATMNDVTKGTFKTLSWTGSLSDVYVRIYYTGTTAIRVLDEVSITATDGGGSTIYYHSTPDCGPACTDVVTIRKGTSDNGSFKLDKTGEQSTCNGAVTVTLSDIQPADGYQFSTITQSGVDDAKVTIDNVAKTVTYAQNTTGTSVINVEFTELPKYTVTFDANTNGICSTISLKEEFAGAGVKLPDVIANDGYRFLGWATTNNATTANAGVAGEIYKPAIDVTLYAVYIQQFTVQWFANGELLEKVTYDKGAPLLAPTMPVNPCSDEKQHIGWTTQKQYYDPIDAPSPFFEEISGNVTDNLKFYAVYATIQPAGLQPQELTETITFNSFTDGTSTRTYDGASSMWLWRKNDGSNIAEHPEIRLYAKHSMTIAPQSGCSISKIVATISENKYVSVFANGGLSGADKSVSELDVTLIPTGGNIVITQSDQSRVVKFVVTFTAAVETPEKRINYTTSCTPPAEYTITWWANGEEYYTQTAVEGTAIDVPTNSPNAATYACDDKVFVGWVDAEISGSTNTEPTFITEFGEIEGDKAFFAVFATEQSSSTTTSVYKLVTNISGGKEYIFATGNSAGSVNGLTCDANSNLTATSLAVKVSDGLTYIETPASNNVVWNITGSSSSYQAQNKGQSGKYLRCYGTAPNAVIDETARALYWDTSKGLYGKSNSGSTSYYLYYDASSSKWGAKSSPSGRVYAFEKSEITFDNTTYSGYVTTCEATTEVLSGKFSTGKYEYAEFATGNLQYKPSTDTWRFAKQQYQVVGEDNINVGNPNYKGWIDMLGWSTNDADNNYGVNPNNVNDLYDGTFQDWGDLFSADENWSTLSADQWKYLLNERTNASSLKQIARVGSVVGIMLFPDNWNAPLTVTAQHDSYFDVDIHNYTLDQWAALENAGALFLPAAGRRTGGYGNKINKDQVVETNPANLNGGHYKHQDNTNIYCYYWTSTINESTKDVSYLHNIQALGGDKYTIGTGAIWGEKGRYGQSVRLAKVTSTLIEIGGGDNSDVITANEDKTVNVKVNRTFMANNGYYTICLPFNIDADEIGKAYQIKAITEHVAGEGINVEFTEVTTLTAGQPYLLLPSENLENPTFEGVTIVKTTGETTEPVVGAGIKITFTGIINGVGEYTNGNTDYYVGDNGLLYNGTTKKLGLRAFFTITDEEGNPTKVRARVVVGENTTTDLENILNGENTTIKVIENGQLIIIRNGEKFNAQGQKL